MSQPDDGADQLTLSRGPTDPSQYSSPEAKARFAVAKYYSMGSDGQWSIEEIADALDVSTRQVYRYLNESEIGQEVEDALAVTDAEWRLDAALRLRREVDRLEDVEVELLQRTTAVPTEFDEARVEGIPTADGKIVITDAKGNEMRVPIPTEHEEIVDYDANLERVQKEKRQHIEQIIKLLALDIHWKPRANRLSEGSDRSLVEYRQIEGGGTTD